MFIEKILPYQKLIEENSDRHSIDNVLIGAMILQETNGDSWKCRFEPNYYQNQKFNMPNVFAAKVGISTETEKVLQCTSWGLMQIMGVVSREMGYTENLTKLLLPEIGIAWGCRKLDTLLTKYLDKNQAISAYNHGSPIENDTYLSSVTTYISKLTQEGYL